MVTKGNIRAKNQSYNIKENEIKTRKNQWKSKIWKYTLGTTLKITPQFKEYSSTGV